MATSYNSISRNRRRRGWRDNGGEEEEIAKEEENDLSLSLSLSRLHSALRPLFRGVSARYTSFNRIRMQCCGKFHLSEAREGERERAAAAAQGRGGVEGQARQSGSRCDFVSTLRTPSRVLRSRCSAATFAYPLLAFASAVQSGAPGASRRSNLFTRLRIAGITIARRVARA